MQDLLRIIADSYKDFSSGQKKVGDLFFQEPIFLAFSSALEVGRRVNVSESTVIRWTQKLGYRGYAEFQQVLQRKLAEDRLGQTEQKTVEPVGQSAFENLLDADIASLLRLKQLIHEEKLVQVVDAVTQAKHIYITSNFFDYGIAHGFSMWLKNALGHTELMMPSEGPYFSQLSGLGKGDLIIAFAFSRYTKAMIETLKAAKEQEAEIIIITDAEDSPAIKYADLSISVFVNSNLNMDSYTAIHALLASIMRFIYVKEHAKVKENLSQLEKIYKDQDIFL